MRTIVVAVGIAVACTFALWAYGPGPAAAQYGYYYYAPYGYSSDCGYGYSGGHKSKKGEGRKTGKKEKKAMEDSGAVIGKTIYDERGNELGTIENVVLSNDGTVQYVVLSGDFQGARGRLYPVPWNQFNRSDPNRFVLNVRPERLAEAPSFTENNWPNFRQNEWQSQVSDFYASAAQAGAAQPSGLPQDRQGLDGQRDRTSAEINRQRQMTETAPPSAPKTGADRQQLGAPQSDRTTDAMRGRRGETGQEQSMQQGRRMDRSSSPEMGRTTPGGSASTDVEPRTPNE